MKTIKHIKNYAFAALLSFTSVNPIMAQNIWTNTYGGSDQDAALCGIPTSDSGYIFAGGTYSFGSGEQAWLVKTNFSGETLWSKTYGGAGDDRAYYVVPTTDNGYIMTGYKNNFGSAGKDYYLIKTDAEGDTIWTRSFDKNSIDWALCVQETDDTGYIVVGFTQQQGLTDIWLVKTNNLGDTIWTRTYGGDSYDWGSSVKQTDDGGFIITGFTESFGLNNRNLWLIKTDNTGNIEWSKTYGGSEEDWGRAVTQCSDGGYIIGGVTSSFGNGKEDAWLLRTNMTGDSLWSRTYGGAEDDWVYASVIETLNGSYVLAGGTYSFGSGDADAWLIKCDHQGELILSKTYGGSDFDNASFVEQTPDHGYILSGATNSFGSNSGDAWLIKTDSSGNTLITYIAGPDPDNFNTNFQLLQNFPNPFSIETNIVFYIAQEAFVQISIYDIMGRRIKILSNGLMASGKHCLTWNGEDSHGMKSGRGIYYCRMITENGITKTVKMIYSK